MSEALIYVGSVALEPARWAQHFAQPGEAVPSPIVLSEWLDAIAETEFDGVEVWERHLTDADAGEADKVLQHPVAMAVFNSYVSLDDADPTARRNVARWAERSGAHGIKFNVGNDRDSRDAYAARIAEWLDDLPVGVALLCECHHGISIAETPSVAAAIFDAAGPVERVQAIVHTHEDPDHLRARFDAYGDRISHAHINFLDFTNLGAPRLRDIEDRVASQIALLDTLGFAGTWTVEFTHGVLTENDNPAFLLDQAVEDLAVLRTHLP